MGFLTNIRGTIGAQQKIITMNLRGSRDDAR